MPSAKLIDRAVELVRKRPVNYEHFFAKLTSPSWIAPLLQRGFFTTPPPAEQEGETITFYQWPESEYLARMAAIEPKAVAEIIARIPTTENARVHMNYLDAAIAMPARWASRVAKAEARWIAAQHSLYMLIPDKSADLIERLCDESPHEAFALTQALLSFDAETRAAPRFDLWHYGELVQRLAPKVVTQVGVTALDFFLDVLTLADGEAPYSWIWRPAIEDHAQNIRSGEARDSLIDAVRDSLVPLLSSRPDLLPEVVEKLKDRGPIGRRLALHGLKAIGANGFEVVVRELTAKDNFVDLEVFHEYYHLLRQALPSLPQEAIELLYEWIDTGPAGLAEDVNRQTLVKDWQLRRLAILESVLPDEWRTRYISLREELGEPDHPDFQHYGGTSWVGPTSPKSTEELGALSVDELRKFLITWQPSGQLMRDSPEGLGRKLREVIASNPERYTRLMSFKGVDRTYARELVEGIRQSLDVERNLDWASILDFCAWVVEQEPLSSPRGPFFGADPHWGWARLAVADLVESAISKRRLAPELRGQAWAVLLPITSDPTPSPEEDASESNDPLTTSLNTTRGKAIWAVFRYTDWIRALRQDQWKGFQDVPEASDVLEEHLNPSADPSLAIRAVYGERLPILIEFDEEWFDQHVDQILPPDRPDFYAAAWNTYLSFNHVYGKVYDKLKSHYERSVDHLGELGDRLGWRRPPAECLAEHLMVLVAWGKETPRESGGIVERFFTNASAEVRAHAMFFVGSVCSNESLSSDILDRFKDLWEWRVSAVQGRDPRDYSNEIANFGTWFASGKFPDDWSLMNLDKVVKTVGSISSEHLVVDRLKSMFDGNEIRVLDAVLTLIDHVRTQWFIDMVRSELRELLATALDSDVSKDAATEIINRLGAKGYVDFGSLIRHTGT